MQRKTFGGIDARLSRQYVVANRIYESFVGGHFNSSAAMSVVLDYLQFAFRQCWAEVDWGFAWRDSAPDVQIVPFGMLKA